MDIELIKQYGRTYTSMTTKDEEGNDLGIPYEFHGDITQAYTDGFINGVFSDEAQEFWHDNFKIEYGI